MAGKNGRKAEREREKHIYFSVVFSPICRIEVTCPVVLVTTLLIDLFDKSFDLLERVVEVLVVHVLWRRVLSASEQRHARDGEEGEVP
jgi:hypothetical protein